MVHVNKSMELNEIEFDEVRLLHKHVDSLTQMLSECEQLIEARNNGEAWEEQFLDATTLSRTRVDSDSDDFIDTSTLQQESSSSPLWLHPKDIYTHGEKLKTMLIQCDQALEASRTKSQPNKLHHTHHHAVTDKHWLVSCPEVGLFALFGGQGYYLLSELKSIYNGESQKIRGVLSAIGRTLVAEAETINSPHWKFKYGFDLEGWLQDDRSAPDKWYLYSAPISYPLVMALQICRYLQTLEGLDTTHEQMLARLKGATGHSQGIVSAVLLSMSANDTQLLDNILIAAKYLLYQGLRCYEALVTCASCKFNETEPYKYSPMLAVKGLKPSVLDGIVQVTLKRLHEFDNVHHKMNVSIINGPTLCVVSGQSTALLELQKAIAKFDSNKYNPNCKQPRIKRSTSTAFLSVGAAFHSPINETAVEDILRDARRVGFKPDLLQIPVFHSESGNDVSGYNQSELLRALVEMQSIRSFNFSTTLRNVSYDKCQVTHILDFGPSDGTAKLCAGLKQQEDLLVIATGGATATKRFGQGTLVGLQSIVQLKEPVFKTSFSD